MSILLFEGADPHLRDSNGNTALHHAVSRGNKSSVRTLLDFKSDIEAKTEYGLTPLKIALFEQQEEMAQFLILNGANEPLELQSYSEHASSERAKHNKKKRVKFNQEIHYNTDQRPLCSGERPSQPLKSILKTSVPIHSVTGRVKERPSLWLPEKCDALTPVPEDNGTESLPMKTEKHLSDDSKTWALKKFKTEVNLLSLGECGLTAIKMASKGKQEMAQFSMEDQVESNRLPEKCDALTPVPEDNGTESLPMKTEKHLSDDSKTWALKKFKTEVNLLSLGECGLTAIKMASKGKQEMAQFSMEDQVESNRLPEKCDALTPVPEDNGTESLPMKTEKHLSDDSKTWALKKFKTEVNLLSLGECGLTAIKMASKGKQEMAQFSMEDQVESNRLPEKCDALTPVPEDNGTESLPMKTEKHLSDDSKTWALKKFKTEVNLLSLGECGLTAIKMASKGKQEMAQFSMEDQVESNRLPEKCDALTPVPEDNGTESLPMKTEKHLSDDSKTWALKKFKTEVNLLSLGECGLTAIKMASKGKQEMAQFSMEDQVESNRLPEKCDALTPVPEDNGTESLPMKTEKHLSDDSKTWALKKFKTEVNLLSLGECGLTAIKMASKGKQEMAQFSMEDQVESNSCC
ncbi:uncharacterized protein LOC121826538 isoform X2 [Peromyscus maniculatus bairdii]